MPMREITRICQGRALYAALAFVLLSPARVAAVGLDGLNRSLDRPIHPQTIFITLGPTLGASPGYAAFRPGISGSIVFHPASAADFTPSLFYWNTGIVLHGEYRVVDADRNLLTASYVLRRYLGDMRRTPPRIASFVGAGAGVALGRYPAWRAHAEDPDRLVQYEAESYYFSFLAEFGYEFAPAPDLMVAAKVQWRHFTHDPLDYSNWTVHLQVGIPLPW